MQLDAYELKVIQEWLTTINELGRAPFAADITLTDSNGELVGKIVLKYSSDDEYVFEAT